GTSVTNSAQVTSTTPDPDSTSNSAQVTTVINNAADLRIEKTGPPNAAVGDTVLWVITVRNNGPGIGTGVRVSDTLPAGVTVLSATGGGTAAGRVVTWPTIDTLGVGGLVVFTATAVVTQKETGQLRNFATVRAASSDPNVVDDSASVNTQVNALADVAVLKTGPTAASPGENITYLIRVFNKGPSAAIGVAVSDTLPANATFVPASSNGAATGQIVHWPVIDRLEVGDTVSFNVVARMGSGSATAVNIAAASTITDDPVPANNNGSQPQSRVVTQLGQLDVAIRKRAVEPFVRGVVGRYILTVTNVGQATTNGPLTIIDTLPTGLTFVRGGLPDTTVSQPW